MDSPKAHPVKVLGQSMTTSIKIEGGAGQYVWVKQSDIPGLIHSLQMLVTPPAEPLLESTSRPSKLWDHIKQYPTNDEIIEAQRQVMPLRKPIGRLVEDRSILNKELGNMVLAILPEGPWSTNVWDDPHMDFRGVDISFKGRYTARVASKLRDLVDAAVMPQTKAETLDEGIDFSRRMPPRCAPDEPIHGLTDPTDPTNLPPRAEDAEPDYDPENPFGLPPGEPEQ